MACARVPWRPHQTPSRSQGRSSTSTSCWRWWTPAPTSGTAPSRHAKPTSLCRSGSRIFHSIPAMRHLFCGPVLSMNVTACAHQQAMHQSSRLQVCKHTASDPRCVASLARRRSPSPGAWHPSTSPASRYCSSTTSRWSRIPASRAWTSCPRAPPALSQLDPILAKIYNLTSGASSSSGFKVDRSIEPTQQASIDGTACGA